MQRYPTHRFHRSFILPLAALLALGACHDDDAGSAATATLSGRIAAPTPVATSTPVPTTPAADIPGSATLVWSPPTTNADGTPITDLAGYTINYGTSSSALDQTVELPDATATNYTISNLARGTWYFALNAVNSQGFASALSAVASKAVP